MPVESSDDRSWLVSSQCTTRRSIPVGAQESEQMNRKLFVGNLPFETTESDLQDLFVQAGNVESVRVMRDRDTGRARGFAFVEMATEADAEKAIAQFNDQPFGGRRLAVNEARPQPARTGGFGGGRDGGPRRREPRW
jgi:RNA recognition motif-containing protein